MNKIAKLMCLVAVIALVGTSCKKKEEAASFQARFVEMTESEEDAKLYKVGNRTEWDASDKVQLFNVAPDNNTFETGTYQVSGSGGGTVRFVPVNSENNVNPVRQGAFYGFYPSGNQGGNGGGFQDAWVDGNGHVTALYLLPKVQQYRTINGKPALPQYSFAAAAKETHEMNLSNVNFDFMPINGILKLSYNIESQYVNDPGKRVDHIDVTDGRVINESTGERNGVHTTGLIQMYIDMINPTELLTWLDNFDPANSMYMQNLLAYKNSIGYYVPDPSVNPLLSKTVTLQCRNEQNPNGVQLSSDFNNPTVFYIGMRPGAAVQGMTITVYYVDGTYWVPYDYGTNNKIIPNDTKIMRTRTLAAMQP